MEIAIIVVIAFILTGAVIYSNNYALVSQEKGLHNQWITLCKKRKNSIISLVLGLGGGILLALLSYQFYESTLEYTIKLLFLYEYLLTVAYIDYKKMIIPNKLIVVGLVSFLIFFIIEVIFTPMGLKGMIEYSGLGFLLGGGVFFICFMLSKGGIGMGDVKLFAVIGLLLGWVGVFNVIFLSVVGVAVYGVVMICREKKDKKSLVPVGPFAFIGMAIAILLGV